MALVTALLASPANGVSPAGTLTNTTGMIRLSIALAAGTGPGTWQLCKQNADSTAWYLVPGAILSVGADQPNALTVGQLNWPDSEGSTLYHVVQTRPSGQSAVMTGASVYLSAATVIAQSVGAITTSTITASGAIVGQSTLAITGTSTFTGASTHGAVINWSTGLGAITHLAGPTDQPLAIAGGTGRGVNITGNLASTITTSAGNQAIDSAAALQLGASTATSLAIGNGAIAVAITSAGANSLAVGANGSTNPALKVDSSTASSATGLQIKSAAAAAGVTLSVVSSGTNENLTINAKGTGTITVQSAVATPAAGSAGASLLFGSTAAFGVYYGSGAPTVSAAQGSIYLRSDGSSTSTRLYVNTNGSTTWTNVTTAA